MTDQELKDLVASLAVSQDRTDEQLRKTDENLDRLKSFIGVLPLHENSLTHSENLKVA